MSCSPVDLKDFLFGELSDSERGRIRSHMETCARCSEELERLRLMQAALHAVPEEEPPRRIAFVSDKVFEPRWWQVWWNSAPRLGFASAALLAAAIVVHAVAGPAQRPAPSAVVDTAAIEGRVKAEVASRMDAAVKTAVAESEMRQARKAGEMVEAVRRDLEFQRQADHIAFEETLTVLQKRYSGLLVASSDFGGRQ
jgi:negative regulator of sigma E activity